jgi:hypothetical protein
VDRGVRDPVARVGGPELGARDLDVARQPGRQPPGGLPRRQLDRLHVDAGVGEALRHRLETADRPAELHPQLGGYPALFLSVAVITVLGSAFVWKIRSVP